MKIKRSAYVRGTVFLISTILILYFLPRKDGREYTYEVNRPWSYSLLTAPFDIPVYMDSIRAGHVMDSLESRFEPVYYRNPNIEKNALSQFTSRLNTESDVNLSPLEKNALTAQVRKAFEHGIVDANTYKAINTGELPSVRMIHENVALSVPTSKYCSVRKAYATIDSVFHDSRFTRALSASGLSDILTPNIILDTAETRKLHDEMMQRAMAPIGVIQQGERIIDRGDIVTPQLYTVLRTYDTLNAKRGGKESVDFYYPIIGQTLYIILLLGALYSYLFFFRPSYYESKSKVLLIMITITAVTLIAFGMSHVFTLGIYMVPFAIVPVILVIFLDARTAVSAHIVTILLASIATNFPLEFIFMQFLAGVTAIDSLRELTKRSQLLRTAFLVFIAYSLAYISIELFHSGSVTRLSPKMFGFLAINSLFISFAYVAIFLFEKTFGFISKVSLVELSDINNPLLRELSEECPGTFQHSMAVSNLASAAANKIGANVQLVRAGALYHDIGKINNPAFFTENQHGVNPHDALDPIQSARIVIGHITDGLRRADKANLPESIRTFIREHHGAGKAKYFYNTWCNTHPGEEPDEKLFTYPGPNPQSKETSILMMADAVEAASRSLKDHTPETISALVNKIIDSQIADGLHDDSPMSFRDIKEVKEVFANRLRTMFHSRISYPDIVKPKETDSTDKVTTP
ncbi:MAG: HDIG domain-containing protein [Paramuribaculum sp.]|nr:HDIG domain-containing protein [Paramuribaculum sp.]